MDVHFTARKFRARKELKAHAIASVQKLDKFYDGIVRADVILSFERATVSVKTVEINVQVQRVTLAAKEHSEDYLKSLDLAINKLERQLTKYKTKIRLKNKKTLRRVKRDVGSSPEGDEE